MGMLVRLSTVLDLELKMLYQVKASLKDSARLCLGSCMELKRLLSSGIEDELLTNTFFLNCMAWKHLEADQHHIMNISSARHDYGSMEYLIHRTN